MGSTINCCSICGYLAVSESDEHSWLSDYKVLCNHSESITNRKPHLGANAADTPNAPLFHTACLSLLQICLDGTALSEERLLAVCASLPTPLLAKSVSWDHDYGGLWTLDEDRYPWEDDLIGGAQSDTSQSCFHVDPLNVAELLSNDMCDANVLPELKSRFQLFGNPTVAQVEPAFSRLAPEIKDIIATFLPTSDALSLRLCSSAFTSLLYSPYFWRSRFSEDDERGYCFEARGLRSLSDWISKYKLTNRVHDSPSVANRRRVWRLVSLIADLLILRSVSTGLVEVPLPQSDLEWVHVSGDIFKSDEPMASNIGCRSLASYRTSISQTLEQITVFMCTTGPVDYVCGMQFIASNGLQQSMGYCNSKSFTTFDIDNLSGFVLAVGPRGIHALKVVDGNGRQSSWAGRPGHALVTERLLNPGLISALEVEVDAFKMTRIGTCMQRRAVEQSESIRHNALWFPSVPPSHLSINSASFTGHRDQVSAYEPLFWTVFNTGDKKISGLRRVSINYLWKISSIEFHCVDSSGGTTLHRLGRSERHYQSLKTATLDIDGERGEQIQSLKTTVHEYHDSNDHGYRKLKYGVVRSIQTYKVITNFGRSLCAGRIETTDIEQVLRGGPGSVITGLFASQHPEYGLTSLGIMCEFLQQT